MTNQRSRPPLIYARDTSVSICGRRARKDAAPEEPNLIPQVIVTVQVRMTVLS